MPTTQILMGLGAVSANGGGGGGGGGGGPVADFTIEWWQKVENAPGQNSRPWSVGLYSTQILSLSYERLSSDYFWINNSFVMTTAQNHIGAGWRHMAYVRSGGVLRGYINGTQYTANVNTTSLITDTTTPLYVGTGELGAGMYQGYITDLHIIKGTAKYLNNFTAPTSYLNSSELGSVFLLPAKGDGTGVDIVGSKNPVATGTYTTSADVPFAAQSPVVTNVPNPFNIPNSELYINRTLTPAIDNVRPGWTFVSANYSGTVTSSVIGMGETYRNITLSITSGVMDNSTGTFSPPSLISYYFNGSTYLNYGASPDWAMDA